MSHCPTPSRLLSSSGRSSRGSRLWRTRESVRDLDISHAQLIKAVLEKVLFRRGEIALSFFRNQAERVDGLARADDVHAGLLVLLPHQAQLQHRRHVQRSKKSLEGDLELFGGVSIQL